MKRGISIGAKRRQLWRAIVSSIKETYPFCKESEVIAFSNLARSYGRRLPLDNKSDADFFLFMEKFFVAFGNSHTKLNKYPNQKSYLLRGYKVLLISGNFYLMRGADYLGRLISVNGVSPQKLFRYHFARIAGATRRFRQSQVLKFILADKIRRPAKLLVRVGSRKKMLTIRRQEPIKKKFRQRIFTIRKYGSIVYVGIASWLKGRLNYKQIDVVIKRIELLKPKALIIDVRGNGGGSSSLPIYFAGHFFSSTVLIGTSQRRSSKRRLSTKESMYFIAPRQPFLNIPIVMLIDSTCLSANEIFIAGMNDNKRVLLLGESTGGGSGSPRLFKKTYGRRKVTYQVSTWRYYRRNGRLLEGNGIRPHIIVKPRLKDIKRGKDTMLAAALYEAEKLSNL
jgi:Peptidase family S41